jgi:ATP-binding cassette, subfamily C, bacterial
MTSGPTGPGPWRLLVGSLAHERRPLVHLMCWSLVAAAPAFASGRLVATAVDQGFLAGRPFEGVAWLALLGLVVVIGALAARRVPWWLGEVVEPLRDRLVRLTVVGALRRAVAERGRRDAGAVAQLTGHVEIVRDVTGGLLLNLQSLAFTMAAATVGLFLLEPVAALVAVAPVLLALLLLARLLPTVLKRNRALLLTDEELAASVGAAAAAMRDVVACGAEARATGELGTAIGAQAAAARAVARATVLRSAIAAIGGQSPVVVVLIAAPYLLSRGQLTPGELLGIIVYVTASLQPAVRATIDTAGASLVRLAVALRRIAETAAAPPNARTLAREVPGNLDLSVNGVTFGYSADAEPIVRHLDLAIPYGSHLAVVGPSGIGKSTLANLLVGLTVPGHGTIRLGGVPISDLHAVDRHSLIGLIPQEAYVFAGTVRENLAYLRPDATPTDLDAAVRALGLRHLLDRVGGYDAEISGGRLSAGERQLVALARVWLSRAEVVILDEATCHLDPVAERRAEEAFVGRGTTLVVIAHRISSARRAERVLLMDGARPYAGTHAELLAGSALYAELVGASEVGGPAGRGART